MNSRKIILGGLLGVIVLFFVGEWVLETALTAPLKKRRTLTAKLERGIATRKKQVRYARGPERRMYATLRKQSLPSNKEVARSLYQAWLVELVEHVGLTDPSVDSGTPTGMKEKCVAIAFSVRGRGSLEQIIRFLYEFYNAGHLHQIGSLGITPVGSSGLLDLSISINTLILPGADRKAALTRGRYNRLASAELDAYRVIIERNLFAAGSPTGATDQDRLTGVTSTDGAPMAWVTLGSGETLGLRVGESLHIGPLLATIVSIEGADVVVTIDGQRWLLTIGDRLTKGFALLGIQ